MTHSENIPNLPPETESDLFLLDILSLEPEGKETLEEKLKNPLTNEIFIIGGPGSGKSSTIMQLETIYKNIGRKTDIVLFDNVLTTMVNDFAFPEDKSSWTLENWDLFSKQMEVTIENHSQQTSKTGDVLIVETVSIGTNPNENRAKSSLSNIIRKRKQEEILDNSLFLFFAYNPLVLNSTILLRDALPEVPDEMIINFLKRNHNVIIENMEGLLALENLENNPSSAGKLIKQHIRKSAPKLRIQKYIGEAKYKSSSLKQQDVMFTGYIPPELLANMEDEDLQSFYDYALYMQYVRDSFDLESKNAPIVATKFKTEEIKWNALVWKQQ